MKILTLLFLAVASTTGCSAPTATDDLARVYGDADKTRALAALKANEPGWNFGNVIHDANSVLGLVALQQGKVAEAKAYLLEAGATPGSPQLDSFGPPMLLARRLVEKGETDVVLKYLDLVAKFWAPAKLKPSLAARLPPSKVAQFETMNRENGRKLEAWKELVGQGKTPDDWLWSRAPDRFL